jgi:hypothetical protein
VVHGFYTRRSPFWWHDKSQLQGVLVMLIRALHRLHPDRVCHCPALFITWVGAALLSVLALRDRIVDSPAVSLETLSAAGLWGALLVLACGLAIWDRDDAYPDAAFPIQSHRQTAKQSPTPVPARVR